MSCKSVSAATQLTATEIADASLSQSRAKPVVAKQASDRLIIQQKMRLKPM